MRFTDWILGRKRRVILFKAAVGMPPGQVARVLAGKADHPLVVAVNQILAEELAEQQTVASDPRVQADTHRVAHALGAVDACAQLRAGINEMTRGKDGE